MKRKRRKRVPTGSWYPPDYPVRELNPWRSLRCFETCLSRWKIIRRIVCTAVAVTWLVG